MHRTHRSVASSTGWTLWRATLFALACFTLGADAEEPGQILRNGVYVYKAPAPQQSEYFVPGTLNLLPPLSYDHTTPDGLTGVGVQLTGATWTSLRPFSLNNEAVYESFLTAMSFTSGDQTLTWPVDPVTDDPISFLGASTISELFGSSLSRAYFSKFGWHADYTYNTESTEGFGFYGFPRVGAPQDAQIPPDYPPITHDIAMSNSPLVPATEAGTTRAIYSTRETLDGQLDLITGQPLLREVDLEIAFGGAVFRRIRTYSEIPGTGVQAHNWHDYGSWQRSRTAGWHGSGWMSSDAPLFLIDAGFAQTVSVPTNGQPSAPRCIFALDAHHAIPFTRQVSPASQQGGNADGYNVDYIAPEWFDAILLHEGGTWDGANHRWLTYPTEFRVILNKRSVTYIIKPYFEDVEPADHRTPVIDSQDATLFDTGAIAGFGVPYYGLVTEIRDRAGNRVEISYASGHQPFDGPTFRYRYRPDPVNEPDVWEETDLYRAVRQRGWYKGMIDHVKLYAAGDTNASWTLLYTYRAFAAHRHRLRDWNFWDFRSFPPALHSILAYEQDLPVNEIERDLILKCHEEPDMSSCLPDPPGSSDGWYMDADSSDPSPDGHSSAAIDKDEISGPMVRGSAVNSPPFSELLFADPVDPCDTWMTPRPVKGTYDNQFDYQDDAIGPAGEGEDSSTWSALPDQWVKQVRYSYADPPQYAWWDNSENAYTVLKDYTKLSCGPVELPSVQSAPNYARLSGEHMAYLLKARFIERDEQTGTSVTAQTIGLEKYWLYRYQDTEGAGEDTKPTRYVDWASWETWQGSNGNEMPRRLSYRFGPRAVDSIAAASLRPPGVSKNEYVNQLIGLDEDDVVPTLSGDVVPVYETADTTYLRWSEPYRFAGVQDQGGQSTAQFSGVAYPGSWAAFDGQTSGSSAGASVFQEDLRQSYLGSVETDACGNLEISQAVEGRTGFLPEGTSIYSSRDSLGNQRWYRMYRFITVPEDEMSWRGVDSDTYSLGGHDPTQHTGYYRGPELVLPAEHSTSTYSPGATQALYHYPYRFAIADFDTYGYVNDDGNTIVGHATVPRKDPMWWTVVDEYDSLSAAMSACSSLTYDDANSNPFVDDFFTDEAPWLNRRVVALNSAGLVLSDRTWDGDGGVNAPPAVLEAFVYDDYMRLTMKFSRGWGSELVFGHNEGDKGRVDIFTYEEATVTQVDPNTQLTGDEFTRIDAPREVKGVWLNKGCLTPQDPSHPDADPSAFGELHVSELLYYRDVFSDPPEHLAGQLYSQAVYDLLGHDDLGTIHHRVEYWTDSEIDDPEFDPANPPIKWEIHAGAVFKREPTGPDQRPVDITFYDKQGRLVWRVYGSMAGIVAPGGSGGINTDVNFAVGQHDELFLDYRQYDDEGREYFSVQDIDVPPGLTGLIENSNAFNINDIDFPAGAQQQWPIDEESPHGILFLGTRSDVQTDELADNLSEFWAKLNADISLLNGIFRQAEAPPLDLVTYREFSRFGSSKVVYPTGVRDLYQYYLESDYLTELKAMGVDFDGTEWGFAGQQLYDSDFDGNQFVSQIQAVMDDLLAGQWDGDPYSLSSDIFNLNRIQVIADVTPTYDSAGRLVSMIVSDPESPAEPIEQFVAYDGWGNILRSQDADGAVTRMTYDKFGRQHKTFRGSKDRHEIWGTADIGQDDDDMFLVEKLYYGKGTNDAGEVTHKWSFREKSPTQYGVDWDEPSESVTPGQAPPSTVFAAGGSGIGESSSGILETYEYDWRMRKVITRYQGLDEVRDENDEVVLSNKAVIREERIFLDNADRVRFVAVYDGPANSAAPSPDIPPGQDLPEPADFFEGGAASNLLSLQETVYNGAGQTVEQKRYDPGSVSTSVPGFLVTHNFTDHGNRPTWSRDSGQRISKNVYDAKGRLAWSSVWAGGVELSRTVNAYGPADTVDRMAQWERIDTDGSPSSSFDDAAKRVRLTDQWFDRNKRLIASADFGWQSHAGPVAGYQPPSRQDQPPVKLLDLPSGVDPVDPNDPDAPPAQSPPRLLVGIDYPAAWIGADGRGLASVSASWYGPGGQKNAALNLLSAVENAQGGIDLTYTVDRSDYNNYGQKVLEHRYGYSNTIPDGAPAPSAEDIEAGAEFLGGTAYSYELEGYDDPQDPEPPPVFVGTKVRNIMPLTAGHVIVYNSLTRRHQVDWHASTDPELSTTIEYNAPVVEPDFVLPSDVLHPDPLDPYMFPIDSDDWGHLGVANRPDLVKAVHLPDPVGGGSSSGLGYSLFYFYYADGLPAVRLDSRGIALHYIYDERGNLLRLESDDSNMPLVAELGLTDAQLPSNAIEYEYDSFDRLVRATTARDYADGQTTRIDTESVIEYDRLGNMLKEYQSRNGAVNTGSTRFVGYGWERVYAQIDYTNGLASRDNIDRITSLTYPARVGTHDNDPNHTPRVLHFGYGAPGSVSDLLGRVESVTASGGPTGAPLTHIADYSYEGIGRLTDVDLGRPTGGTPGAGDHVIRDHRDFDAFGRVSERTVTSWDGNSAYRDVMHSEFGYDLGGRRVYERLTQQDLNGTNPRDNTHSMFYEHDAAGRLVGERYGALKSDGFDGIDHAQSPAPRVQSYGLDLLNRRVGDGGDHGLSIWEDLDKDGVVDVNEITTSHDHVVDKRGVLTGVDDGSSVTAVSSDASGAITGYGGRSIYSDWLGRPVLVTTTSTGAPVVAYAYDAFGRLARRTAPWPTGTAMRIEEYHYDGVRRIQEVFTDPVSAIPPWPQQPGQGGGSTPETRTEAEYVWSAASGQPFDTCHVQIDWWDREAWFVQDHQTGTVRAYTDPSGEIAEQYGFDAFGNLLRRDQFTLVKTGSQGYYRTFRQRLGHQGLFADRLDGHTNSRVIDNAAADLWYQSRSRWYAPELGRFTSSDPNATGIPVQASLAMLGMMPSGPPDGSFGWESHYGDGWDVFTAYGASPVATQDPLGLWFSFGDVLSAFGTKEGLRARGVAGWGAIIGGGWGAIGNGLATQSWEGALAGFVGGALAGGLTGGLSVGTLSGWHLGAAVFGVGAGTGAFEVGLYDAMTTGKLSKWDYVKGIVGGGLGNLIGLGLMKENEAWEWVWPGLHQYGIQSFDVFRKAFLEVKDWYQNGF